MKSVILLSSILLSTLAFADISEEHQKNCETAEVKEMMGESGSCRIVVAPKQFTGTGVCYGKIFEVYNCQLAYSSQPNFTGLHLACGNNPKDLVIDQFMEGSSMAYNVATLIKDSEGNTSIQNDKEEYKIISNSAVKIILGQNPQVSIRFSNGEVSLSEVRCQ